MVNDLLNYSSKELWDVFTPAVDRNPHYDGCP